MKEFYGDDLYVGFSAEYDHGLSREVFTDLVNSPFRYASMVMDYGNWEEVRLPYFGVFKPMRVRGWRNLPESEWYGKSRC